MKTGVLWAAATGAGILALSVADAAYRTRDWGASDGEVRAVLPGDELLAGPVDRTTLAVSVAAPVSDVWDALYDRFVAGADAPVGDRSPVEVRPDLAVVLREGPAEGPPDVVRSYHVVPTSPGRCRLVTRTRAVRGGGAGRVAARALDPVAVVLTRRTLLAIAAKAEAKAADRSAAVPAG